MNLISRSRSLMQQEEKLNSLISNMLMHILSLLEKDRKGETDKERVMLNYLNNLHITSIDELKELLNIINSGRIRKLSKFISLESNVFYTDSNGLCTSIEFMRLSDPSTYRKVTKKLKELKLHDIKSLFENYYTDLCFLVDTIIDGIDGFSHTAQYSSIENCLVEVENLVRDIVNQVMVENTSLVANVIDSVHTNITPTTTNDKR